MQSVIINTNVPGESYSDDLANRGEQASAIELTALDAARTGNEANDLAGKLRSRVVGQDEAIQQIVRTYQAYLAGLSPAGRPIASFLFLGPTGSGKTRVAEATAEALTGDRRAIIKIDCAEFQHSHEIAKLIGSPPGYLGHRETRAALSQEALDQYHTEHVKVSLVLFDEIEKASNALWNLLLGILDKATLTLGDNRRVDFSRAIIFMTSNLGAAEMEKMLRPKLGFTAVQTRLEQPGGAAGDELSAKLARIGLEAVRRRFTPEFMNRIDKTVVFHPLSEGELRKILEIELDNVQKRILAAQPETHVVLNVARSARDFLLVEGTDVRYGARPLKRAIERHLVHPLSNLIVTRQLRPGDCIRVTRSPSAPALTFYREEISEPWQVNGVAA